MTRESSARPAGAAAAIVPPDPAAAAVTAGRLSPANRALALLAAGALFMELLDGTAITPALPSIAHSFGVAPADLSIAITAYLCTIAVLIPLSGWLVDRIGARLIFATAIAVFTLSSAACALSTNVVELTATRVAQAVGGAMMVPVGRLVVLRGTAKSEVMAAVAYITWPALFAPVVAPVLGGVLTTYASWRWIFLLNLPLGVVAFVIALRLVPSLRAPSSDRLDRVGLVTSVVGLGALVYGASLVARTKIPVLTTTIWLVVGAVFITAAVIHLRRTRSPLVDLDALRIRTFRITAAGGTGFRLSILAIPFLLPLMFEDDFGWSAARAGATVLFVFLGNLGIKPATTPLLRRFGFRAVLTVSLAAAGLSTAACGFLSGSTPLVLIAVLLVIGGAFRSITFTVYNTIAFADVEDSAMAHANTLFTTIQQLAGGLAVATAAATLRIGDALRTSLGRPDSVHLPYLTAFVLVSLLMIPPLIEAIRLPATAGGTIGGGAGRPRSTVSKARQNERH